ncbi:MAG: alpha-2-macroglobulin [Burkholderiaceae bacterium]|nr:alpha-2-macroglobulin [Burkholderiaceae bacterium]
MNIIRVIAFASILLITPVWGAQIVDFSPQGQVSTVESVKLRFDKPVIAFGDGQAAAPVDIRCNDSAVVGHGRWLDGSRWTYEFTKNPGPGVSCQVSLAPSFQALDKAAITGTTTFSFQTGGPFLDWVRPSSSTIDEDQAFVLAFNAPVDAATVVDHAQCVVQGLGEMVPVRLITGQPRQQILDTLRYLSLTNTQDVQVVQCQRLLPSKAKVQLRVGPGVATLSNQRPAVVSTQAEVFDYTVRDAFTATFSCSRENSSQPCVPVSNMTLQFSAPIAREVAEKIRLQTTAGELTPIMTDDDTYVAGVDYVRFQGPFPESSEFTISLPPDLRDDAGRTLQNADQFPLISKTAAYPPLIKFSAATFGLIERFAYAPAGGSDVDNPPSMPLSLRSVEPSLATKELVLSAGKVADYATQDDLEVLHWYSRVQRMDESRLTASQVKSVMADQVWAYGNGKENEPYIDTRGVSLLQGQKGTRELVLPGITTQAERPFEVIGVPLPDPGFHVIEVASPRLGASLLESATPMYVRTTALVTNLSVHIKTGRDDMLAWVTTLDDGLSVANANINVLSCTGVMLANGVTDAQGIWHHPQPLPEQTDECPNNEASGIYVSARIPADHPQARGKADFSFAFSDWNSGIQSWRFNVSTDTSTTPTHVTHTVLDRSLFRAGEMVSMKHFIRDQTRDGFAVPKGPRPTRMVIEHQGSGDSQEFPVQWVETTTGGVSATNQYVLPKTAKLGIYTVSLSSDDDPYGWYGGTQFRVEEFKLPLLTGSLKISDSVDAVSLIAPDQLTADVQLAYVSGGPAGQLPVQMSGVVQDKNVAFQGYEDYSFNLPNDQEAADYDEDGDPIPQDHADQQQALFLNKQPLILDNQGGARLAITTLPTTKKPQNLLFEASFADPNGEIQTLAQTVPVWPAAVVAGIRTGSWMPVGKASSFKTVALSTTGQPQAGVPMIVTAIARTTYSSRQRMVGGFYSYQSRTEARDLGMVCQGSTDAKGVMECPMDIQASGRVQLLVSAQDAQGRQSQAATTVWLVGQDELWFGGNNDDRIDIIPAKKTWKPGETAEFQVRMPFRLATALVAVEREGVLETHVVKLKGNDPTVRLPVRAEWGPNVYVSVLAVRGRLREVPWYSFFSWGWKQPGAWYDAYTDGNKAVAPPSALIDLSKPAFRFGLAEIQVSDDLDQLQVKVSTDKERYQVRDTATVTVQVTMPDGKPAANGTVAFAAVDQALLELSPNPSWDLLTAMRQLRSYGVETATAQMQVVGRRHYGRKALPAGGGGGKSPTRELLDTLLLWQPDVVLDAQGQAQITLPLNDAITRFTLVAISDYGVGRFGTGKASIVSTQDLQVIGGLPAQVREGDRYQAMVTVRNASTRDMSLQVQAGYTGPGVDAANLAPQTVALAAGQAQTLEWTVQAPESDQLMASVPLDWILLAQEQPAGAGTQDAAHKPAADRLAFKQVLKPVFAVRTRQSTLLSLDADQPGASLPVSSPDGALKNALGLTRGGLQVHLQSSLAGGLPGVREWFQNYPYTCLEQISSKAIGLRSQSLWDDIMENLPAYLDDDGLVSYFPGAHYGNEVLTAYLIVASHEAQSLGLPFALPEAIREQMTQGLLAFAQGKLTRQRWSPVKDDTARKLLVLEALSRYDLVTPRMLDSIRITPDRWPTSSVIDWVALLQRVPAIPKRIEHLAQARQIILGRMLSRGTELVFADNSDDNWWWLMTSPETNLAKLMLVTLDQKAWTTEQPLMAQGLLKLQRSGAWRTTTSNLLGSLAIEKFAQHFERQPVSGQVLLQLFPGDFSETLSWDQAQENNGVRSMDQLLSWGEVPSSVLLMQPEGTGQAWATVSSLAAVKITKPVVAGYQLERKITPVSQATPGVWSRGDVYRVSLTIQAKGAMTWAALTDPIPAGATILGSGLGRDSSIATDQESDQSWRGPTYVERSFESWRGYYEYLPAGETKVEYTVRLNTPGQFQLPPTRIETLYNPEVFGELPNLDDFTVQPSTAY